MEEIWKPVVGYEGYYEVSNTGKVKSLDRTKPNKWGTTTPVEGRELKPEVTCTGYKRVVLNSCGRRERVSVHRLVAFAFPEICGEWAEGYVVNHKDENPSNNNAWNIEWCTIAYNNAYGNHMRHISQKMINRKDLARPILQLDKEGNVVMRWPSIKEAERSGIASKQNIMRVLKKRPGAKYTAGYQWVYENEYAN